MHGTVRPLRSKVSHAPSLRPLRRRNQCIFGQSATYRETFSRAPPPGFSLMALVVPTALPFKTGACVHSITEHPVRRLCVCDRCMSPQTSSSCTHNTHDTESFFSDHRIDRLLVLKRFEDVYTSSNPTHTSPVTRASTPQQTLCHGQLHTCTDQLNDIAVYCGIKCRRHGRNRVASSRRQECVGF